ncbi:TatD family hydrolase [[Mycoplasma] mobile]|uniref:Mg-dependent DNAse n=1 Tax=Mycoplasma mobile (strain ATCC 43663 / 163K / NCTC 11711) TaxID=267748 RepID=Q6KH81_MYCM1|nr:TatD family hydrolase [[Mycoplasma] mobile]AAT28049.1 Mg-dependent DNAse [Mycoplasma mobile 163K]
MKKYSDVHTHPLKEFYEDGEIVIKEAIENDVEKLFIVGTSIEDSKEVKEICKKFPENLFPIIGIHPSISFNPDDVDQIEKLLDKSVVGIGEVGLDFYYDNNPKKELQIETLKRFLRLSISKNIPTMIHMRNSIEDMYEIFSQKEFKNHRIVFHTYSGNAFWAKKFLDLNPNIYFSFSGVATFKNAKDTVEAIKEIPVERIFVETDAPFLTPVPYRGTKNKPVYVKEVAKFVASLKKLNVENFNIKVNENIERFFNLSKYVS